MQKNIFYFDWLINRVAPCAIVRRLDTTRLLRYDRSHLGAHLLWYASLEASCQVCRWEDMKDIPLLGLMRVR